jgi:two-component system, LuxR family, response regulator FixJ
MLQNGGLNGEIFIADDDAIVRESMSSEFSQAGYHVLTFSEGRSCVAAARVRIPACIVIDLCMPGESGLDILEQLDATNYPAPIFIVSGHGDIPTAVEAIRNGACDFIEKRMDPGLIVKHVVETIDVWKRRQRKYETSEIRWRPFPGRDRLTRREIEVLEQIAAGATNKAAARILGISQRTLECHRWHIMKKLGAKNAVDLVRKVLGTNGDMGQYSGSRNSQGSNYADSAYAQSG